jgi:hypothetical protein
MEAALQLTVKLLIAQIVGIISISIAYGYHRMGFLRFVRRLLEIVFLFTLQLVAMLISAMELIQGTSEGWFLIIFLFFPVGVFVLSALEQNRKWGWVLGLSYIPILLYAMLLAIEITGIMQSLHPEAYEKLDAALGGVVFMGIIVSIFSGGIGQVGALLGEKTKLGLRIESIGSRIREDRERARERQRQMREDRERARERARKRQRQMNEFRATLDRWEAEGYSELKGVMGMKSFDQMERAFMEVKQKIKRLKAVESTLNKLFQDFPQEEAVFELEIESIRSKLKNLSKVNEVESAINNLKDALAEHRRIKKIKNEILDMIREAVERKM